MQLVPSAFLALGLFGLACQSGPVDDGFTVSVRDTLPQCAVDADCESGVCAVDVALYAESGEPSFGRICVETCGATGECPMETGGSYLTYECHVAVTTAGQLVDVCSLPCSGDRHDESSGIFCNDGVRMTCDSEFATEGSYGLRPCHCGCEPGTGCDVSDESNPGARCIPEGREGDECMHDGACAGVCRRDECATSSDASPCYTDSSCDRYDCKCMQIREVGESCRADSQCESKNCAYSEARGGRFCMVPLGAPCSEWCTRCELGTCTRDCEGSDPNNCEGALSTCLYRDRDGSDRICTNKCDPDEPSICPAGWTCIPLPRPYWPIKGSCSPCRTDRECNGLI